MIINVRGTHGSGKTTLVRRVMEHYKYREPIHMKGRKAPIGYVCRDKKSPHACTNVLFVAGSYESVTGGCDTIPKVDLMYKKIKEYADLGYHVLFEGILAQHSTPNIKKLYDRGYNPRVIVLDVPVKKSIRGVKKRRAERGDTRPFNPTNVRKEAGGVLSTSDRLKSYGVKVILCKSRRRALNRVLSLLELATV